MPGLSVGLAHAQAQGQHTVQPDVGQVELDTGIQPLQDVLVDRSSAPRFGVVPDDLVW